MAKENTQPKTAPQEDPVSQLGAIQNIIIGPAMAEFSKRLAELESKMQNQHEALSDKIQDLKSNEIASLQAELAALTKRFEAFEETVKAELERLEGHKANLEDLGDMLVKLGESVKGSKK